MSNTPIFTPTGGHFGFVRFSEGAPWFSNFFQFFLRKWDQEVSSDQFIRSSWWSETMTLYSPPLLISYKLPDITGRTALAVRPDVVNAKYHVITNATYNRDPVPAKFKHVTNIDTCTLVCCDYSTLWEALALHVNMVEIIPAVSYWLACRPKNLKCMPVQKSLS